jgi:hypothetical protein
MVCEKCGTEVTKKNKSCPKCGEAVNAKRKKSPEIKEYNLKDKEVQKLSELFISRDEKYIASLGNGYIMNFLTNKSTKKGFAFITNKRVYFKGSCLSGRGRVLVKTNEERTVDVKNITGSGFIYKRYWGIVIALIITLLVSLAGTIASAWFCAELVNRNQPQATIASRELTNLVVAYDAAPSPSYLPYLVSIGLCLSLVSICSIGIKNYLLKRKTLFRIEYAGGGIAFDVSFYAKAEIDDFQRQLRRVKDYAEETATIKTVALEAPAQSPMQSSKSDELRKYADLLKEGLITQDEYDTMKKKILEL